MSRNVFALDIGTQSITGILLRRENERFHIVDFCIRQHKERTMLDGQIQHVVEVAQVIQDVKSELEETHGPLKNVCVAAAGRALKTITAQQTLDISAQPIASEEELKHLELSAVQQALTQLTENNPEQSAAYHCVGYSVLYYKLDGEEIGSLIDQVGSEATVEVIATFLPRVVVESLLNALQRANLEMEALTLEPIAAIHVLVPESMRRLNVALIDIGAGTSDIAISNDGTIVAYGMVPHAGDEITEVISDHYLLDFKVAERVKKQIVNEKEAIVEDILGFETTITYEDLLPVIQDEVEQLARSLAQEVRSLNGTSPQAVMLIGGGSLTPLINERIAQYLQLPKNRVAIRGTEAIQLIEKNDALPKGPDFVTPVGIAISATENPLQYMTVYVNEKPTFMFQTKQLTVGDALIQAGIDLNTYYGKIGLAKIFTLNGKQFTLRGEYGEPPTIYLNDEEANVSIKIEPHDRITIEKGVDGDKPIATIQDIAGDDETITFYFEDERKTIEPEFYANGKRVDKTYVIQDKDDLVVKKMNTVQDFLESIAANEDMLKPFVVYVNKRKVQIERGEVEIHINGQRASKNTPLQMNDRLSLIQPQEVKVEDILDELHQKRTHEITVFYHGNPVKITQNLVTVERDGDTISFDTVIRPNDQLTVKEKEIRPFIFQDVFRYVDIDLQRQGGTYKLLRNDEPIHFHEEIVHGDHLEIVWAESEYKSTSS